MYGVRQISGNGRTNRSFRGMGDLVTTVNPLGDVTCGTDSLGNPISCYDATVGTPAVINPVSLTTSPLPASLQAAASGLPSWALPAAIGIVVLGLVMGGGRR